MVLHTHHKKLIEAGHSFIVHPHEAVGNFKGIPPFQTFNPKLFIREVKMPSTIAWSILRDLGLEWFHKQGEVLHVTFNAGRKTIILEFDPFPVSRMPDRRFNWSKFQFTPALSLAELAPFCLYDNSRDNKFIAVVRVPDPNSHTRNGNIRSSKKASTNMPKKPTGNSPDHPITFQALLKGGISGIRARDGKVYFMHDDFLFEADAHPRGQRPQKEVQLPHFTSASGATLAATAPFLLVQDEGDAGAPVVIRVPKKQSSDSGGLGKKKAKKKVRPTSPSSAVSPPRQLRQRVDGLNRKMLLAELDSLVDPEVALFERFPRVLQPFRDHLSGAPSDWDSDQAFMREFAKRLTLMALQELFKHLPHYAPFLYLRAFMEILASEVS